MQYGNFYPNTPQPSWLQKSAEFINNAGKFWVYEYYFSYTLPSTTTVSMDR